MNKKIRSEWSKNRIRIKGRFVKKELENRIHLLSKNSELTAQEYANKNEDIFERIIKGESTFEYSANMDNIIKKMTEYQKQGYKISGR